MCTYMLYSMTNVMESVPASSPHLCGKDAGSASCDITRTVYLGTACVAGPDHKERNKK